MPNEIVITIGDAGVVALATAAQEGFKTLRVAIERTPEAQLQANAEVVIESLKTAKAFWENLNRLLGIK